MDKPAFATATVAIVAVAAIALMFFSSGTFSSDGESSISGYAANQLAKIPRAKGLGQQAVPLVQDISSPRPGCAVDAQCPFDKPLCDKISGSCVGCKTSVCVSDTQHEYQGFDSYCCVQGTGQGTHLSKYDDSNFECWTSCSACPA